MQKQTITIELPTKLVKKLRGHKRRGLNIDVSTICQKAIEKHFTELLLAAATIRVIERGCHYF